MGAVDIVQGGVEAYVGGALCATILGCIAGGPLALHGADTASAGSIQLWEGVEVDSLTSQGLQAAGLSRNTANNAEALASFSALTKGLAIEQVAVSSYRTVASEFSAATSAGKEIKLVDGFYQAEGSAFKFSEYYYNKLWSTGRGAPFLQAKEVLSTAKTITPDRMPGFNRYVNDALEMIYNPNTKEVWHLQPLRK